MILNYIYFFEFYLVLNYCEDIGLQHLVLMDWVQSVENLQEMFEVKCRISYFNFHKIGYTPKTKHQQIKQLPCQTIKKLNHIWRFHILLIAWIRKHTFCKIFNRYDNSKNMAECKSRQDLGWSTFLMVVTRLFGCFIVIVYLCIKKKVC